MDWYLLFKFLHVSSAIMWIGSGFGLVFLGAAARRAADRDGFMRIIHHVIFLTPRLFIPVSLAAFVFGLITAFLGGWNTLWIWLGLAGFAATFTTGFFVLKPRAEQVEKLAAAEGNSDRVQAFAEELLSIAEFDFLMLFVVVADMVMKPGFGDWLVLLVFVVALAGGAAYFVRPMLMRLMPATTGMKSSP